MATTGRRARSSASTRSSKRSVARRRIAGRHQPVTAGFSVRGSRWIGTGLSATARWLRRRAENVSALLLLTMFLCFILHDRRALRLQLSARLDRRGRACSCWIWCTLVGRGLRPARKGRSPLRHHLQLASATGRAASSRSSPASRPSCCSASRCPRSISYVTFLKVERSAYLGIRLDYLYSIYILFSVARHHPLCAP